eukprot:gene11685-13113_t
MSTRRRKTLSHSDLENFLSDISSIDPIKTIKKRQSLLPSDGLIKILENDENHLVVANPPSMDERFPFPTSSPAVVEYEDERELIRKFCKLTYTKRSTMDLFASDEVKVLASQVLDITSYPLMSKRYFTNEFSEHTLGSIEAKKAVLIKLTPSLSSAEEERKREVQACEEFTRCKASKSKIRSVGFEYIDIDTNIAISYQDYENRYLMFIYRNKSKQCTSTKSHHSVQEKTMIVNSHSSTMVLTTSTNANLPTTSVICEDSKGGINIEEKMMLACSGSIEDKENSCSFKQVPDSVPVTLLSPKYASKKASNNDRKRKHDSDAHQRRGTLSPTTMKTILLDNLKDPSSSDEQAVVKLQTLAAREVSRSSPSVLNLSNDCAMLDSSSFIHSPNKSVSKSKRKGSKRRTTLSPSGLAQLSRRPSILLNALEGNIPMTPQDEGDHDRSSDKDSTPSPMILQTVSLETPHAVSPHNVASVEPAAECEEDMGLEMPCESSEEYMDMVSKDMDIENGDDDISHPWKNDNTSIAESSLLSHLVPEEDQQNMEVAVIPNEGIDEWSEVMISAENVCENVKIGRRRRRSQHCTITATFDLVSEEPLVTPKGQSSTPGLTVMIDEVPLQKDEGLDTRVPMQATVDAELSPSDVHSPHLPRVSQEEALYSSTKLTPLVEGCMRIAHHESEPLYIAEAYAHTDAKDCQSPVERPLQQVSPFTASFGPRSVLQTLIHEAMEILKPYQGKSQEIPSDQTEFPEDLRAFQLIEQLVWQHAGERHSFHSSMPPPPPSPNTAGLSNISAVKNLSEIMTASVVAGQGHMEEAPSDLSSFTVDHNLIDEEVVERAAKRRMHARMEEARFRYVWEVTSAKAANKAALRFHSK